MSVSSYRRNVALGVSGARKPTCMPAAMEQLVENYRLPPEIYKKYSHFTRVFAEISDRLGNFYQREMLENIVSNLGGLTCRDLVLERVANKRDFKKLIRSLMADDYNITVKVDVEDSDKVNHIIGLVPQPNEEEFRIVSNYVPRSLQGMVTLDDIYNELSYKEDTRLTRVNRFIFSNIIAMPLV